jgi:hypothetical protein
VKGKERSRVRRMKEVRRRKEESRRDRKQRRIERELLNPITKRNCEKESQIPSCVT